MTVEEFAVRIALSSSHTSNIERGKRRLTIEIYKRVEKAVQHEIKLWNKEREYLCIDENDDHWSKELNILLKALKEQAEDIDTTVFRRKDGL